MARYTTYVTDAGVETRWKVGRLDDKIAHKHQETLYLRYQGYDFPFVELVSFSYPDAVKFLKKPSWKGLPWVFESDSSERLPVAKQQRYAAVIGDWLADLMSDADKDHLLDLVKQFVSDVDKEWKHRRKKRWHR